MVEETKGHEMRYVYLAGVAVMLTACTYSIAMVHTKGTATDVIDENQTASPNVSPNISVPLVGGVVIPEQPKGMNGPAKQA
jgi:hypothetical protein